MLVPGPSFSLRGQDDGPKETRIATIPPATFPNENLQGTIYFALFVAEAPCALGQLFLKLPTGGQLSKECSLSPH